MPGVSFWTWCTLSTVIAYWTWQRHRRLPLPPLLTGADKLQGARWEIYAALCKTISPIATINSVGVPVLILSTVEATLELFSKRSNFSCRPRWPMADLLGRQNNVGFQYYGERLKQSRKILNHSLNPSAVRDIWAALLEESSTGLMQRFLKSPDTFYHNVEWSVDTLIFRFTYGREPDHEYIEQAESAMNATNEALQPGKWWINTVPSLAYIPSWMPGAGFQRWARSAREKYATMIRDPFLRVQDDMASGDIPMSFVNHALQASENTSASNEIIMSAAGSLFSAGTETLVASILNIVLLLTLHPEVQERAYSELVAAIGSDRLPTLEDQMSLPYVDLIIQECQRISPPVPLVGHSNIREDTYLGYRIPKKSWVLANIWGMLHDDSNYTRPLDFDPDRFASVEGHQTPMDPRNLVYGLGRRICPGMHFANSFVFLVAAKLVACFELVPIERDGTKLPPPLQYTTGLICKPQPFMCIFKPRTHAAEILSERDEQSTVV
ncbi:cytochrome P450 [Phanerochaete sordida]|uniref:Cytochrome P450 n=1 Tax=Phanerochaete sordida TaxID=48140 RepID=A0A9P3LE26_9APHY|nr:cytochrome P450 [Phanerochaete sordida]